MFQSTLSQQQELCAGIQPPAKGLKLVPIGFVAVKGMSPVKEFPGNGSLVDARTEVTSRSTTEN
ncbi:MAG: hypothetical protein EBW87_04380 [Burkholderiaceae bacterium]|nr:hypothetical protein [Burkholderiaceae bacterium]